MPKVQTRSIRLTRPDAPDAPPLVLVRNDAGEPWGKAERALRAWARRLPAGGSAEVDFLVTWQDGVSFGHTLELRADDVGVPGPLAAYVHDYCRRWAGLLRRSELQPGERFEAYKLSVVMLGPSTVERYAAIVHDYQIGDAAGRPDELHPAGRPLVRQASPRVAPGREQVEVHASRPEDARSAERARLLRAGRALGLTGMQYLDDRQLAEAVARRTPQLL